MSTIWANEGHAFVLEFGGQGLAYESELVQLYAGEECVGALLRECAAMLKDVSEGELDLMAVLNGGTEEEEKQTRLSEEDRLRFSYPLIGLTQLCNYVVFLHRQGTSHNAPDNNIRALIGHSQGVVSACVLAVSDDQTELETNIVRFVQYLYWHGRRTYELLHQPKSMLSVRGLTRAQLEKILSLMLKKSSLEISLVNGIDHFCVTGVTKALEKLEQLLSTECVPMETDQTRIPFSKRKPAVAYSFVDVACPYHHSQLLAAAKEAILKDVASLQLLKKGDTIFRYPVYATTVAATVFNGQIDELIDMQLTQVADWVSLWDKLLVSNHKKISHVLDFGPSKGASTLTQAIVDGAGIQVVMSTIKNLKTVKQSGRSQIYGFDHLLSTKVEFSQQQHRNWTNLFAPRLCRVSDKVLILNRFSRRLGKPPLMVGGMTPTTSYNGIPLVAAFTNAGYHGELACGGLSRPSIFRAKIEELCDLLDAGRGIQLNLLYLNAKQWGFQFPLLLKMRQEQKIPIESVTIAAGIPSPEKADEILAQLFSVGIQTVGFKPGSTKAILEVVTIATQHPEMTVILQWTGGRAGGHHSFEDFHQPLLQTYSRIRSAENILLVVGSGFGDDVHSFPYLNGTWSKEKRMPVDAILLASRVMVAKEAATALPVKKLICQTKGDDGRNWENSYDGDAGGILTINSELGQPIHKILNRGMECWRHFDKTYFSLPLAEREKAILKDKDEIIRRLDADYQKPYFQDLEEMTYLQVLNRLVELMYTGKRWLDVTYQSRFVKFITHIESKFINSDNCLSLVDVDLVRNAPNKAITRFAESYPRIVDTILCVDDIDFFLTLCATGGKPVNFIPVIDKNLITWFKKDSLWYSEDLEAVPDQDPQRVCILQGPVAVQYSVKVDEPVKDILDDIIQGYVSALEKKNPQTLQELKFLSPVVEKRMLHKVDLEETIVVTVNDNENQKRIVTVGVPEEEDSLLPSVSEWVKFLGNLTLSEETVEQNWLQLFLNSSFLVQQENRKWNPNQILSLLKPQFGQQIVLKMSHTEPESLKVFSKKMSESVPVIELSLSDKSVVKVILREHRPQTSQLQQSIVSLTLQYAYFPLLAPFAAFHEDHMQTEESIKEFYAQHWLLDTTGSDLKYNEDIRQVQSIESTVTLDEIIAYNQAIGVTRDIEKAPLDFSTVVGWKPLIRSVFAKQVGGNLLQLVHLSHGYESLTENPVFFYPNDRIKTEGQVLSMQINDKGNKIVQGVATISKYMEVGYKEIMKVTSHFLIRGCQHHSQEDCFTTPSESGKSHQLFSSGGYNMLSEPLILHIPETAQEYAIASYDLNPIHRSVYSAALADLPNQQPIMHGMYTATHVRNILSQHFGSELSNFDVQFEGMIYPGDRVVLQVRHIGMNSLNGRKVIAGEVVNSSAQKVLSFSGEISQPQTAFVFTGQGSAQVGMGMAAYENSEICRRIWQQGDAHLQKTFGFSILNIVRTNPKSLTIHFGGKKGKQIRRNFMNLTVEDEPLIPEINENSSHFTFAAPEGLLFATQFSQPALVLLEKASFEEIRNKSIIPTNSYFAGHSLGEYAGLSSFAEVLAIADLVEIVFLRGLVMQKAVQRDSKGRSNFGMVAANPSRVGISSEQLFQIVDLICERSGQQLLQVVNFNVKDRQYVVAGELTNLETLSIVLSTVTNSSNIIEVIAQAYLQAKTKKHYHLLTRGQATIPLVGIDVPFHSRELLKGVPAFRNLLLPKLKEEIVAAQLPLLINRYIPNLVAKPFVLEYEYVEEVAILTQSPLLTPLVQSRKIFEETSLAEKAHKLVVELLAYQFASPVQWIQTQELLFAKKSVTRFIEIGPAATLTNMALRTLQSGEFEDVSDREILWFEKHRGTVCYDLEDKYPSAKEYAVEYLQKKEEESVEKSVDFEEEIHTVEPATISLPAVTPVSVTSSSAIVNCELSCAHVLKVILASKFNMTDLSSLSSSDTSIKSLCAGKSAIQNEIIGDLEAEFKIKSFTEEAAELPLNSLIDQYLKPLNYSQLGPFSSSLMAKMITSKMPAGFNTLSAVSSHLISTFNVTGHIESIVLHGIISAPKKRLTKEQEAHDWIQKVASNYGSYIGKPIELKSNTLAVSQPNMMMQQQPQQTMVKVSDEPIQISHVLQVLLCFKLNKKLADLQPKTDTIKALCSGKSAVENEIVGDLVAEFGLNSSSLSTDVISESSLVDLAAKITELCGSSYLKLGSIMSSLSSKLVSSKLPMGISEVNNFLKVERCLPPNRINSIFIHMLSLNPTSRFQKEDQAYNWLNSVVDSYGKYMNISIPHKSTNSASNSMIMTTGSSAINNSELERRLIDLMASQSDLFNEFIGTDKLDKYRTLEAMQKQQNEMEMELDTWNKEHGEVYAKGIAGKFDADKERRYDSFWNWVMQDARDLYYYTIMSSSSRDSMALATNEERKLHFQAMTPWINVQVENMDNSKPPLAWFKPYLCNRATPELYEMTQYYMQLNKEKGNLEMAQAIQLLSEQVSVWMDKPPVNLFVFEPTQPHLKFNEDGSLIYEEVKRNGVKDSTEYVDEMARGLSYKNNKQDILIDISGGCLNTTGRGLESINDANDDEDDLSSSEDDEYEEYYEEDDKKVEESTKINPASGLKLSKLRASLKRSKSDNDHQEKLTNFLAESLSNQKLPFVHIKSSINSSLCDYTATRMFLNSMHSMTTVGVSFSGKNALVTGCGKNSIGIQIVQSLLQGGARVFVTTSSSNNSNMYRELYESDGAKGSQLIVLPFNQASGVDVELLIKHIYENHENADLDYIVPFAAISEVGIDVTSISDRSELAHRLMLTNVLKMIGCVASQKQTVQSCATRPAYVLLPLSPNHGTFGGDGLYAESKLGLESLMNKWASEGWSDFISICGAVIGWTRGTGLMSGNNQIAEDVEKETHMRTFSQQEMALNLMTCLHPNVVDLSFSGPVLADLSGGMAQIHDLKKKVDSIRTNISTKVKGLKQPKIVESQAKVEIRANLSSYFGFHKGFRPTSPTAASELTKMMDLEQVVVVTGFGEVGPWGSSRTRWEMESYGQFSMEGCIELAWLCNLITYQNSPDYIGWVDAETKKPVADQDIKQLYEERLLNHSGIRLIEPELFDGYDPMKAKSMLHQVAINRPMSPIEVSNQEEAEEFRTELGIDNVDIYPKDSESGSWMIRLRKGALISIPRALQFDRFVAGQIPTGWDPKSLGIPADLVDNVDAVTLYTLVATAEALICSGITDPYEFYEYVHVSAVGNTSGGGMGGMKALRSIYGQRQLGKDGITSDVLQECFINTMPAYVNMLLLSSSGPIKTPVGACATAAESVDIGVETIKSKKARVVIVGGYDDFGEEGSYEFAQMKATSDSRKELKMGRRPKEMCRPCTDTRAGFMESQGAGIQVLMDAQLAIDMGCPIYAIVALTNTATDKNGRSVPAPGQGILTTARESGCNATKSLLLDPEYRRRQFEAELTSIANWKKKEISFLKKNDEGEEQFIEEMEKRKVKAAQALWGGESFYQNRNDISPLRGALSMWGLTIDDIGVASFHGTGTKANDKNESEVTQKQLSHLGRSKGNPVSVVCQKYLTGHPKGAAAAWMFNGLVQILESGLIPGNRNLDNTDPILRQYELLTFPSRSIQTDGVNACVMKSFGFGQAGGEILLIHPKYLMSMLRTDELQVYSQLREQRIMKRNRYYQNVLANKHSLVQVKSSAPYTKEQESQVYLNPMARAFFDPEIKSWRFGDNQHHQKRKSKKSKKKVRTSASPQLKKRNSKTKEEEDLMSVMSSAALSLSDQHNQGQKRSSGLGVDVEPIETFQNLEGRDNFIARNFTAEEQHYCFKVSSDTAASFAGRWAAKEAIIKAISSSAPHSKKKWKGAGAPLIDIEIVASESGAPTAILHGEALAIQNEFNIVNIQVSISHSGDYAVAQAIVS